MSTLKKASGALMFATSAVIGMGALTGCHDSGQGTTPSTTVTSSTAPANDTATSAPVTPVSSNPAVAPPTTPLPPPQTTEISTPQPQATQAPAPPTHPQTTAPKPAPTLSDPGFTPRAGY